MRHLAPLSLLLVLVLIACTGYVSVGWGWGPDYPWCCGYPYDYVGWSVGDDPYADLLVATEAGELYRVPYAAGTGLAAAPTLITDFGDGGRLVDTGDVDGDGTQDLVVVDPVAGTAQAFLGDGLGGAVAALAGPGALPVSSDVLRIHLADLDDDGRTDLVVREANGDVHALIGSGDGAFAATGAVVATLAEAPGEGGPAPFFATAGVHVALGAFDGATGPDLLVVDASEHEITVYSGVGDGTFDARDARTFALPGILVFDVAALPTRGSGLSDLVALVGNDPAGPARLVHYANLGGGQFQKATEVFAGTARRVRVFDLGGDTFPDLLLLDPNAANLRILPGVPRD